jgi:nitrogen-specific signal transduction histidine kinase
LTSLAQLANGVAHDLNNILTPLLMAVQLLRKDPPPEQRTELLDTARAGVARGVALVQRLQTLSGTTVGEQVPIRVEAVVDEVLSALKPKAPAGVHYQAEIANGLWPLEAVVDLSGVWLEF